MRGGLSAMAQLSAMHRAAMHRAAMHRETSEAQSPKPTMSASDDFTIVEASELKKGECCFIRGNEAYLVQNASNEIAIVAMTGSLAGFSVLLRPEDRVGVVGKRSAFETITFLREGKEVVWD